MPVPLLTKRAVVTLAAALLFAAFNKYGHGQDQHPGREAFATPLNLNDDVFEVTGSTYGTSPLTTKSRIWPADITSLIRKFTCSWIRQGTSLISRNGNILGLLNYGTGQCDRNQAARLMGEKLKYLWLN